LASDFDSAVSKKMGEKITTGLYKVGSFQGPNSGQNEGGAWHVEGTVKDENGKEVWYSYNKWTVTAGEKN
jgi:hypothetical protein